MKKAFIISIALLAVSCAENPNSAYEAALKEKVLSAEGRELKDYKSEDLIFTDTVTVAKRIFEIEENLKPYYVEKNLNDFKKKRNQEFKLFHLDPSYEHDIMRGKLKDASPWCTELREVTETADSLIANWDKVSPYDYDYVYTVTWYIERAYSFVKNIEFPTPMLKALPELKDQFQEREKLLQMPEEDIVFYRVKYLYSYFNEFIGQRVTLSRTAAITPYFEVVELDEPVIQ